MTDLFLTVLEISVSVSPVILLLLLLSPLLNRRYAAKWNYLIWIFLAVRMLIPFSGTDGRSVVDMALGLKDRIVSEAEQSEANVTVVEPAPRRIVVEIPEQMTTPLEVQSEKSITPLDISAFIWIAGSLLFIVVHMASYLHYIRQVMKNGRPVKEAVVLQQLLKIKRELHIRHAVPVIEYSEAASPMLLGFFRPVLVLPDKEYSKKELFFILKHELVHVKRGDVYWKLLFVAANGMHWFNPIVWFMQKEAAVDMELSCDERVTRGADLATKKAYTETLLSTLHKGHGRRIALSTGFYGGKQIMKKRFQNILRKTGKKNGFSILACAVALTVSMGTLVGCSVVKEHIEEMADNKESEFAKMAGSWMIDFERTDPNIWGTGISFGDEMEISESGEFSYYIGITVGGTGQCEEDNGEISVEIEPYEPHSEEKEILTLKYENDGGTEYILMDWYGETVYWKRSVQSEEENLSENLPVEESVAEDTITLTIMKEGFIEEKQATLVVDDEGFSFYLPDGEWQRKGASLWYAVENEDVMLWVAIFESDYPIEQILLADNYVPGETGMTKEEDGLFHKARLYEAEDKIWLVEYCYPVEAEEGWGSELAVIADTFAVISENSELVLGYITDFGGGTVTIDRQDWIASGTPDWKPEYDDEAPSGFMIVDLEGEDAVYPISSDCKYFILENHQGESVELDAEAFEKYWRETEFPIFWGVTLVDGEVVDFAEWYRP